LILKILQLKDIFLALKHFEIIHQYLFKNYRYFWW